MDCPLSYGYNFMLDNANATSAAPILDPQYIITNDFRHSGGINATYSDRTFTGHSLSEVANNFSASASAGGGLFGFNGEVGAAFNMNTSKSSEHEYAMTIIGATLTNVVLETQMDDILQHLLPTFMAALTGERDWYVVAPA